MKVYGLIGRSLSHSASRDYFTKKFHRLNIQDASYELFEIPDISDLPKLLKKPFIKGFNVTIPYKEAVIEYLDLLSEEAKEIGAVNTIYYGKKLIGYNTDAKGFLKTLDNNKKYIENKKALILGSGGASKAVIYILNKLQIDYLIVSRSKTGKHFLSYSDLSKEVMQDFKIIINCTPVGMYPKINYAPLIPYHYIGSEHFCYDLIYNPVESRFLQLAYKQGAKTLNGYDMLVYQAEEAWMIWNS
ncbi:MAG: shikimate dehydrogenase family protein [Solitalea-like symbiont of Acarus siro]